MNDSATPSSAIEYKKNIVTLPRAINYRIEEKREIIAKNLTLGINASGRIKSSIIE